MRKVNNKLIQYCKDNDFPIDEMGEDYFKAIEKSLGYQRYLLAYSLIEFNREAARPFKKIITYVLDKLDNLLK